MRKKNQQMRFIHTFAFMLSVNVAHAGGQLINSQVVESGGDYHGFVVKFRDDSPERADTRVLASTLKSTLETLKQAGAVDASAFANRAEPLDLKHFRSMTLGADVVRPTRKLSPSEGSAVMRQLASLPNVEYVEPDVIMKVALPPNDSLYSLQWGYNDSDAGIRADQAWGIATGAGVTVAVLDTGITSHSDLNANVVAGYDFISDITMANDGNGRDSNAADPGNWTSGQCGAPSNSDWHGTHVAGTIAAVTNNGSGVAGTAFGAKIMPVRVLGVCGGAYSDIADAIIWASGGSVTGVPTLSAAATAKVINMSLGGPGACGATLQNAVSIAISRGTTVVAAAGNLNSDVGNFQPANCTGAIAVAAVDSSSSKASFSNYGAKVAVSAPGAGIWSTLNTGTTTPGVETYQSYSGTSMASPHVAGVAALVQSRRLALGQPLRSPTEIDTLLKQTAYPLSGSCPGGCGAGIVNAKAAVDNATINSTKINEHTDASGKIKIAVFERTASTASQHFTDFSIEVPGEYVVIGGGAEGAEFPQGNLLTASYPNADLSAWLVSSKDHLVANPTQIKGWAIGLKIEGLSRQQLRDNLSLNIAGSANVQHPDVSVAVPSGFSLIGGGFKVNWSGAGNLATGSYPDTTSTWRARSKDHGVVSPATEQVYALSIRNVIPGVGNIVTNIASVESSYAAHPQSTAFVAPGYALSGCGALVNWSGAGNLLWKIKPVNPSSQHGCEAGSKDHAYTSPATIRTYAVGITVN